MFPSGMAEAKEFGFFMGSALSETAHSVLGILSGSNEPPMPKPKQNKVATDKHGLSLLKNLKSESLYGIIH